MAAKKKSTKKKATRKKTNGVKKKDTKSKSVKKKCTKTDIPDIIPVIDNAIKLASYKMGPNQARKMVDSYYVWQNSRIRASAQIRAIRAGEDDQSESDCTVLQWFYENALALEEQIKSALLYYADASKIGRWAMANHGIGPVLASGLMAHIDITKAKTPGHIYSFGGYVPGVVWKKGQKRPWNADLKALFWKVGESFRFQSTNDKCFYGHLYKERFALEQKKNEAGEYAGEAKKKLENTTFSDKDGGKKAKAIYESGKLPDGHILSRARRYAVKKFISHWWEAAYYYHHGKMPGIDPYAIAHLGHVHRIEPVVKYDDIPDTFLSPKRQKELEDMRKVEEANALRAYDERTTVVDDK